MYVVSVTYDGGTVWHIAAAYRDLYLANAHRTYAMTEPGKPAEAKITILSTST